MDIITRENLSILLSILAITISACGYLLNMKKFKIEKENTKREYKLGTSKIAILMKMAYNLKNINPKNLSYSIFQDDKKQFEKIFLEYDKNEELISKTNSYFPTLIFNLKVDLEKIEENFNKLKDCNISTSKIELLRNYEIVFYTLSMICRASNYENSKEIKEHFYNLHLDFLDFRFKLQKIELEKTMANIV